MNLRDQILNAAKPKAEPVEIPEWDATVYMRPMTVGELESFERKVSQAKGGVPADFRSSIAVQFLCDEQGSKIFKGEQDVRALADADCRALDRVLDAFMRINRRTENDMEELRGKSQTEAEPDSFTDSPSLSDEPSES